jgi:DNA-binding transcriptional ArsR family regulator
MTKGDKAPFSFEGLDRVLHEKARLSIMTSLADHPKGLSFTELRELCALTDGNLSRHVQILEEAGMLSVTKGFEGRRPHDLPVDRRGTHTLLELSRCSRTGAAKCEARCRRR